MRPRRLSRTLLFLALLFLIWSSSSFCQPKGRAAPPVQRWKDGSTGCTFSHTPDGKNNYEIHSNDLDVVLSVDGQELQLTRRRLTHFFGVFLEVRYRGAGTVLVDPGSATLEFTSHYRVKKASLDPGAFAEQIESGAEELSEETGRQVKKHPERKEQQEKIASAYQKDAAELLEFVNTQTMKSASLSESAPRVSGWILFGTDNRWIGKWKDQEDLVLRIMFADRVWEFPFTLPPKSGDVTLKQRD